MLFTVKSTKKAIRNLCERAEREGYVVEHRIKGDVDNVYINGILIAEVMPGWVNLIIRVGVKEIL